MSRLGIFVNVIVILLTIFHDTFCEGIVRRNEPVEAAFGKRTIIRKSQLRVKPPSKDLDCTIHVSYDEAASSARIGEFLPHSFPCNYKEGDVFFNHFGVPIFNFTSVDFLVSYTTPQGGLLVTSFSMDINVSPPNRTVVSRISELNVKRYHGYSQPISPATLGFNYDRASQNCRISILSYSGSWPRYGNIVNDSLSTTDVKCDVFLSSMIAYRHTELISPRTDYVQCHVVIEDETTQSLISQEWFAIQVNIREGAENKPPTFSQNSLLQLKVHQFITTAITPDVLSAEDDITPNSDLIFSVAVRNTDKMMGTIVSTTDQSHPITSFSQSDVQLRKIAYRPVDQDSDEERVDRVPLVVVDADGLVSTNRYELVVTIMPKDTKAPIVTKNTGLKLLEGKTTPILYNQHLILADEDNLPNVTVTVEYGLKHGKLEIPESKSYFTVADLQAGNVLYQHDDSDTLTDNIIFKASDGSHEIEFLFPIMIMPVDDSPPILRVNTGLQLFEGSTYPISSLLLRATDPDSIDSTIRYILEQPYSIVGDFVLRQQQPDDLRGWRKIENLWEKKVTSWTQEDINKGFVHYKHVGQRGGHLDRDRIQFKLSDDHIPPNISPTEVFNIRIIQVDSKPPTPSPGASFHLTVPEGKITTVTDDILLYTDTQSRNRTLTYTITSLVSESDGFEVGKIVYTDDSDTEVSSFTQGQINKGKISFKPADDEIGLIPHIINVLFDVKDASGNVASEQRLTILVQPVNNKPPRVTTSAINVFENGYAIVLPGNLNAADPDTSDESLTFTVVRTPKYGDLKLQGGVVQEGSKFAKMDIANGGVVYSSTGGDSVTDSIVIEVSDGKYHIPAHLRVKIQLVDSEFPTYEGGDSLSYSINVNEGKNFYLSKDMIPSSGVSDDVKFNVSARPLRGSLSHNVFDLSDLESDSVYYGETQREVGVEPLHDSFNLSIVQGQIILDKKLVPQIVVQVTINPVDNNPPVLSTGSTFYVPEGGVSVILPTHLSVVDVDSTPEDVLCTIDTPANYGFLELSSPAPGSEHPRTGQPITAFSLLDLNKGDLNYRQSIHEGVETDKDTFHIVCSDGTNADSTGLIFDVSITPNNDETPKIYINEFVVEEGKLLQIDLPILNVIDKDQPPDVISFKVLTQPVNGLLLQSTATGAKGVTEFSFDDIRFMSKIAYLHNGTETTNDSFVLEVSDGVHKSTKKIPITVLPIDDEVPQIIVNTGLYIDVEKETPEMKYITNKHLKAEDVDSPNGNITFKIRQQPVFGFLQRRADSLGELWDNITRHMTFQQWEIDDGVVRYVHNGRYGVRDIIKLDISDNHKNSLLDQRFYISVEALDMVYPDVVNRGVELPESKSVILTTGMLSAWDDKSSAASIVFTITSSPKQGRLELVTSPGIPITTFSQIDLAAGRIRYIHTGSERQSSDGFEFEVTDGFNPLHRAFSISILPADNELPLLMIQPIRLREKGFVYITPNQLMARDRDTPVQQVVFSVVQEPLFGSIQLSGENARTFTQDDIENGRVTYRHTGPEATDGTAMQDFFKIKVSDGVHRRFLVYPDLNSPTARAQKVSIQIASVDDSVPQLCVNQPVTSLTQSSTSSRLSAVLTREHLKVKDKDTLDRFLLYWIIDNPSSGKLMKGDQLATMWTQADIANRKVKYVLNEGTKATSDHFTFRVQDGGGNSIPFNLFSLSWSYVSFKHATVNVNETDGLANITVLRRGSLKETSFVSIRIGDLTAVKGQDYSREYVKQIQFNPGEFEKTWSIEIIDDSVYEIEEMLTLELTDPVATAIEPHEWATLTIKDPEDQPTVSLDSKQTIELNENVGRASIKVRRQGDLLKEVVAICNFKEGTTKGTDHPALYTDFILRSSAVRFAAGQQESFCYVDIIDDTYVEPDEYFDVYLEKVEGGLIGENKSQRVAIVSDPADLPKVKFQASSYHVSEGSGSLTIEVERKGGDISITSHVLVMSGRSGNHQAKPMSDYIPISQSLTFKPGEMMKAVRIAILDDRSMPVLEGEETFSIQLRYPDNATLSNPNTTVITIIDETDIPELAFAESQYFIGENNKSLNVPVRRYGDVSMEQKIYCVTTPQTAQEGRDFAPKRFNSEMAEVKFLPGMMEAFCSVTIVDDTVYEGEETFKLRLVNSSGSVVKTSARITITDEEDRPVIKFSSAHVYVSEPSSDDQDSFARVILQRSGDTSQVSMVTVYTKEGSAIAGLDYVGNTTELTFGVGVRERTFDIKILYDGDSELRESFFVLMSSDSRGQASISSHRCSVYISDESSASGLIFPIDPVVISLSNYDSAKGSHGLINGYPLICVTPCDERHPEYSRTKVVCDDEGIDNRLTTYRWKVGQPVGRDGVKHDLQTVVSETFMSRTDVQTLDSIYFGPGSRVQCLATASGSSSNTGLERASSEVTVSLTKGICKPQRAGYYGGEPYLSKIKYLGADHKKYPNHIKLSVSIPHHDGMLPAISTSQLSNFDYMLSPSSTRIGLHRCSNLVKNSESQLNVGWRESKKADAAYLPYQHDRQIRGSNTVKFYSHLDLENCVWEFDSFFKLSELIGVCGAAVETSGQVSDLTKSYVSLVIPLHVSYIFHSMTAPGGWQHFDLNSKQRVTFVYDTALLLRQGVANIQADDSSAGTLSGRLYLHSVKLQPRGHLAVEFQTETNFYGVFKNEAGSLVSSVQSLDFPELVLNLELLESEQSFDNPKQRWKFTSDLAIQDYTGRYIVNLVPCVAPSNVAYSKDGSCTPSSSLRFELDIELQQVSDPVSEVFSLNTELTLTRSKRSWLSNNRTGDDLSDVAFKTGEKIYGRVDTRQLQDAPSPYDVLVEKVFVCTGKDGFVPKYQPDSQEYGCAAESGRLQAQYKILDKSTPTAVTKDLNGIPFNAVFAKDHNRGKRIYNMPGVDGFVFDSKPLNADLGRKWFVHVIYSVNTLTDPMKMFRRYRRARQSEINGVGQEKGTNMAFLFLAEEEPAVAHPSTTKLNTLTWALPVAVIGGLLVLVVAGIFLFAYKIQLLKSTRKKSADDCSTPRRKSMPVDDETTPMSVDDEIGTVRMNCTVSSSEI